MLIKGIIVVTSCVWGSRDSLDGNESQTQRATMKKLWDTGWVRGSFLGHELREDAPEDEVKEEDKEVHVRDMG